MENKTMEKILSMADSATKLAANMSESKKETVAPDNSNNAATGNQSVMIKVNDDKPSLPPVEQHIHPIEFPENRPLTFDECDLALKKFEMDHQLQMSIQTQTAKEHDREWAHKLEVEKKNEKKGKIRRIFGGLLVAAGIGGIGYSLFTDYRNTKNKTVTTTTTTETNGGK